MSIRELFQRNRKSRNHKSQETLQKAKSKKSKRSRSNKIANADYTTLENRQMLAASAFMDGSTLTVHGTGARDVIDIQPNGSSVRVFIQGNTPSFQDFPTSTINSIFVGAGGGNDLVVNRTNIPSRLQGGNGNDILHGGGANDFIYGNGGNDVMYGDFGNEFDGGDDNLFGGGGNDQLYGKGGADVLRGDNGDDFIAGGEGTDWLYGGNGRDNMRGDDQADEMWGGNDNDLMRGGFGNDKIRGQNGNDRLFGDGDNDLLLGADGNDQLQGGLGDDVSWGLAGNDTLWGHPSGDTTGENLLGGGVGNDTYKFTYTATTPSVTATDTIREESGEGIDTIDASGIEGAYEYDVNGQTVLSYGARGGGFNRTVRAVPTGGIELFNDTRDVPELTFQKTEWFSTTRIRYSIFVEDRDGIDLNDSDGRTELRVQVDTSQRTVQLDPISETQLADGRVRYDYEIFSFDPRLGSTGGGPMIGQSVIAFQDEFFDVNGNGNQLQLFF